MRFVDRSQAGRKLAGRLEHLRGEPLVVLGLPRGGVPVGFEAARNLSAPLEVLLVRKLGVPFQPELAMGAVGEGGARIVDHDRVERLGIQPDQIARVERRELREIERQAELFRGGRPPVGLAGKTALIVDDGIATGATALAACPIARRLGAARVAVAAPVAPRSARAAFEGAADEFIAVHTPRRFYAIGQFYADFRQTSDRKVVELLERARAFE